MKVRELIEALKKLDPELEVYGYCEDGAVQTGASPYGVFELQHVNSMKVIRTRDEDGRPVVKFDSGEGSHLVAFIDISQDF